MAPTSTTAQSTSAGSLSCPGCGAAASPTDAACRYCTRVLSSVACDHCFARLFAGMRYCPQCGGESRQGDTTGVATELACPGCGDHHCTSVLVQRDVGVMPLHECLACHGLWLSTRVVDAITTDANARALFAPDATHGSAASATSVAPINDSLPGAVLASPHPHRHPHQHQQRSAPHSRVSAFRYRRCPACAKMMSRVNIAKISGVIVDRCPQHGTFFDIDELHALVRFLEQGGLDRARTREREALADERRRLQMLMDLDQRRRSMEYSRVEGVPETSITSLLTSLLRGAVE